MKNDPLALCGAFLGGTLGYFAFFWIASQGFYALVLPGAAVGLGAGVVANRSQWVAVVCGILAAALGVWTEFRFAPFRADGSFTYFVTHLQNLRPITLVLIAVGTAVGFWIPYRRTEAKA